MRLRVPAWTAERENTLRYLLAHKEKWSAAEAANIISEQYGVTITRNAVIGKCKRLGIALNRDKRIGANPKAPQVERKPKPVAPPRLIRTNPPKPLRCDPLKAGTFRVTELETGMCRYPSGDRDIRFCGLQQVEDTPYCAAHCSIAYRADRRTA